MTRVVSCSLWRPAPSRSAQNTPAGRRRRATFQANTQLVVETVTVKDKNGKPVEGLTAKDFTVTEDGVPQTISFFEFQKLPDAPRRRRRRRAAGDRGSAAAPKLPRTQIAPETPGDIRYRDRRLLALYFDMTAMPLPDQLRALDGGAEVHPHADDAGRPGGDHDVRRRRGAGAAGFHRRPRPAGRASSKR